jgi:glycerophosphoryl diester phosphodiesterase
MVELDVQRSHDGALVVIHDDTVDRTTDGLGRVDEMTLAELKKLDAGVRFGERFRGERIPTLEEVFRATTSRCGLNVEIKSVGVEQGVCALFRSYQAHAASIVSSFEWDLLERVRQIDRDIRIALLAEKHRGILLDAAAAMGAYAVNPRADMVDAEFCAAAHRRGLRVYTWTVDVPELMRFLIAAGVDGIMTNRPELLTAVIAGD